jgi:hypothetical protein
MRTAAFGLRMTSVRVRITHVRNAGDCERRPTVGEITEARLRAPRGVGGVQLGVVGEGTANRAIWDRGGEAVNKGVHGHIKYHTPLVGHDGSLEIWGTRHLEAA